VALDQQVLATETIQVFLELQLQQEAEEGVDPVRLDSVEVAEVERVEMVVQTPEEQVHQDKVMLEEQLHLVMVVEVVAVLEPLVLMGQMKIQQHLQDMAEQVLQVQLQDHQVHTLAVAAVVVLQMLIQVH
jgi:hypothetical protein